MVKCIILEYADGSIGVRGGVSQKLIESTGSIDNALHYILSELVPIQNPDAVARIEDVTFPINRTFRSAWKRGEGAIDVDMPTARIIKTDEIRPERNERLAALDIDYMRADEAGDTAEKERVAVVKQTLRDLPATIQPDLEAIDQPEELEAYGPTWPTEPG